MAGNGPTWPTCSEPGPTRRPRPAGALLADPHPLVAAAAAVWNRPGAVDERWLAGLPAAVERGHVPGQAEADEWARRRTSGLIERFPVRLTELVYLVLASAMATRVSWDSPFELAPASALGEESPWAHGLSQVLRWPGNRDDPGHAAFIAPTAQAGDVAVHIASAQGGLLVVSVAADPGVPAGEVLDAAHEIATARGLRGGCRSARCSTCRSARDRMDAGRVGLSAAATPSGAPPRCLPGRRTASTT